MRASDGVLGLDWNRHSDRHGNTGRRIRLFVRCHSIPVHVGRSAIRRAVPDEIKCNVEYGKLETDREIGQFVHKTATAATTIAAAAAKYRLFPSLSLHSARRLRACFIQPVRVAHRKT